MGDGALSSVCSARRSMALRQLPRLGAQLSRCVSRLPASPLAIPRFSRLACSAAPAARTPTEAEIIQAELEPPDWEEILMAWKEAALPWNIDVASDLIVGFGKCDKIDRCIEVFGYALDSSVDRPNTYLINAMLTAFNRCNQPKQALEFAALHCNSEGDGLGLSPNRDTYTALLVASAKLSDGTTAMQVFDRSAAANFRLERIGFQATLRAIAKDRDYPDGAGAVRKVLEAMEIARVRPSQETEECVQQILRR